MKTYNSWMEALIAFHNDEITEICFELDLLFDYPVRYKIGRKRTRLFLLYSIANDYPVPSLTKLDKLKELYVKRKK